MFVSQKDDHVAAGFTILNFMVPDTAAAVDALSARGVAIARYEGLGQDERGLAEGPESCRIAWFIDPAGNVLAVTDGTAPD